MDLTVLAYSHTRIHGGDDGGSWKLEAGYSRLQPLYKVVQSSTALYGAYHMDEGGGCLSLQQLSLQQFIHGWRPKKRPTSYTKLVLGR